MRALIVGGDGMVGKALAAKLAEKGWQVFSTSRRGTKGSLPLDLADLPARLDLPAVDVCFICAAVTRQKDCAADENAARTVNVAAPARIAESVAAAGGRSILLSSNAVFDGEIPLRAAGSAPCPLNAYGRLKAEAEKPILATRGGAVLRMTKILFPTHPLFGGWIAALKKGQKVRALAGLSLAPITLEGAVDALAQIASAGEEGIFQISAAGDIGYPEACRHIARGLGAPENLVEEETLAAAGIDQADAPRFTSLDASRLAALTGKPAPQPSAALDCVIAWSRRR